MDLSAIPVRDLHVAHRWIDEQMRRAVLHNHLSTQSDAYRALTQVLDGRLCT